MSRYLGMTALEQWEDFLDGISRWRARYHAFIVIGFQTAVLAQKKARWLRKAAYRWAGRRSRGRGRR